VTTRLPLSNVFVAGVGLKRRERNGKIEKEINSRDLAQPRDGYGRS
jgi:hypothetical protein